MEDQYEITFKSDDIDTIKQYITARDMSLALYEIKQYLRKITKYASDDTPENILEEREKIKEEIYNIIYEEINQDI